MFLFEGVWYINSEYFEHFSCLLALCLVLYTAAYISLLFRTALRYTNTTAYRPLVTICKARNSKRYVDCVWNVMAHAQKPDFVFQRNGRVHLNRRWRQFSRILAVEVCVSAVVMMVTPCSEVVWRVLATHSIRQFPLHVPYHASPCAITFQLYSITLIFL